MVLPLNINSKLITAKFSCVQKFRNFTVGFWPSEACTVFLDIRTGFRLGGLQLLDFQTYFLLAQQSI